MEERWGKKVATSTQSGYHIINSFFFNFIEVLLIYNVVLISAEQPSDSVIILFH